MVFSLIFNRTDRSLVGVKTKVKPSKNQPFKPIRTAKKMSARQNKKRKNRNNVNNRERTVTTFTEDPNTSFLVPQPSEEPALSSPFSVASTSATNNPNNNNNSFQNFGMSYNFHPHGPNSQPQQQGQQQQQQQFFSPQVILPPGKSDLEVLENLKSIIKEGQHEFYRAIPQPAALASLYLGPTSSQVLPHPEQLPADYYNHSGYDNSSDDQILPYSSDSARRPTDPPVVKKSSTANVIIFGLTLTFTQHVFSESRPYSPTWRTQTWKEG
ncbi:hypothetical protein BDR07DRAFT_669418 [Suillus spraguei]|nr:hypothetical protein BDR07DRAFT_669418 [Suillus spraguei]